MRVALVVLAVSLGGCGYGLMQTGHTEPAGKLGAVFGGTYLANKLSGVAGRTPETSVGAVIAPRFGLADHVDVGLQPWMDPGGRADVKVDVLAPDNPLAFAPRAGVGYAQGDQSHTIMGLAGGIASYRATPWFEPYLGGTYADHWISRPADTSYVAPGESLVPANHTGDGLVELTAGAELRLSRSSGLLFEYNLWLPANNDPGDGYAFVTTHVFALGLHVSTLFRR